ncbi:MAG: hypothetical protein WD989_00310 [Candidatus Paceibacterota bacterium]
MSIDFILYTLAIMIFWDFSLHVIEMLGWVGKFTKSSFFLSYYYPHFYWKKTPDGPIVRENWQKPYQIFWVSFWGSGFSLMVIYIILK